MKSDLNCTLMGYFPGAIGKVTELHAVYYHECWNFDISFEIQVAAELSAFLSRFDPESDAIITAFVDDHFAGSVAIDGATPDGARLRWFIVDPKFQGAGIGRKLADAAMTFCSASGTSMIHLWTFRGLDCARHIYEELGFTLSEEHEAQQWGSTIIEQRFDLRFDYE